jgi:hypothetical protein
VVMAKAKKPDPAIEGKVNFCHVGDVSLERIRNESETLLRVTPTWCE